jgi:hypothetical protein
VFTICMQNVSNSHSATKWKIISRLLCAAQ